MKVRIKSVPNSARNASKWHGLGGNLYDGLTEGSQQMDTGGTVWGYYTPTGERRYPTASDGETVDQTVDLSNIANPVVTYYRDTGKTNIENVQNKPVGYRSANHPEDAIPFFNDIYNLWNYSKGYFQNKLGGVGEGEVIDLSNKNVSRITSDTDDVASILTNDFVEHNNNVVRKKKDFINTTDTLLGDRKIPLSQISTFYGIEDGKLKVGPLDIFNDETVVVPNRAKYVGKIKEYHPMESASEEYKEAIQNGIAEYNKSKGYEPDWLGKMLPFSAGATPGGVLYHNLIKEEGNTKEGRKRAFKRRSDIMASIMDKYSDLGSGKPSYIITENNDTIRDYQLNASPKALFADENGNAIFVAHPRQHVDEINNYLRNNPMYPIMVDNGRYAAYQTSVPNVGVYSGLNNPNDMFIVGTTKALGGNLYDGITEPTQQMDNSYSYIKPLSEVIVDNEGNVRDPEVPSARGTIQLPEVTVNTPDWKDMVGRYSIASNDALRVTGLRPQNTHLNKQAEEGAARRAAWARENPGLETAGLIAGAAPFAVAATPAIVGGGELAYPILTNPYVDAGITSAFAGHGLNHAINEGIDGYGDAFMTALEIAPLGRVAKPMWNVGKNNVRAFYDNLTMDLTSTPGTYYVGYPKRDISTLMPGKTGGIFLTPDKKFARGYTGAFGTGKVYETKVNFGENPIHIDAKGNYFDRIAEQDLLDAFDTTAEEMKELGLKPFYTKKGLFSKKPTQKYYHIDEISTFGKKKGASSLIVDNVYDQGPGIFGFGTKGIGQQVIVYSPEQLSRIK